ncbi:XrtA/PEP-CTERM system histidine kinase PrsK [Duganella sp. P38]|uniref:XrtA/PEP-CTERM system histidine kinase PrsK n=1 Tax=Duganella sp. P38 TaxID=3423949 RepID=UPI003D7AE469
MELISYGLAALAFLALGLLLVLRWNRRRHAAVLGLACLCSALWAGLAAGIDTFGWSVWLELAELARGAAWTAFLMRLLGYPQAGDRGVVLATVAAYALAMAAVLVPAWRLSGTEGEALALTLGSRALLAVLGMLLAEQLYRQKSEQSRWAVKYACLGAGAMFGYDFYLYTDAVLLRQLSADIWGARGVVNALAVGLVGIAVARSAAWPSGLVLSRQALFHSATLGGAAAYLLAMALAGYYLRYVGGAWGGAMQVAFLASALLLLAGVLFSGTFRSHLKVFIGKHFYRYHYDYRSEWQRVTRTLSQEGAAPPERAIEAMAGLVESPGGALWLRRPGAAGLALAAQSGMAVPAELVNAADGDSCRLLESRQWILDLSLPDLGPALDWLRAVPRARLAVPLMLHGRLFGLLVLQQPRSQLALDWEVIDLLKVAASQVAGHLALQEAASALTTARQFESYHRMSTFVVHDLKNLVAQLSLLVANAAQHRDNPEFQQDMLETLGHAVQKMRLMLHKLQRSDLPERPAALDLAQLLARMVALRGSVAPVPVLRSAPAGLLVLADANRMERVLGHLLQNAIDAVARDGQVVLQLYREGAEVVVEITDTGHGMSAEFVRDRLFKPFDTTKTAGMGIGAFESREYIAELGGRLEVSSVPQRGTTFRVILPAVRLDEMAAEQAA